MNQGQGRSSDQRQEKTPKKGQTGDRAQRPSPDRHRVQKAVFSLAPPLLKNYAELWEDGGETNDFAVAAEELEDNAIDLDTDMAVVDEDELEVAPGFLSVQEQTGHSIEGYEVFLGDALANIRETAVFSPNTVYTITVVPSDGGQYRCRFEGPAWFNRRLPAEMSLYVNRLRNFLCAVARWLENEKQEFLREPLPGNFVRGEAPFACDPVVLQKSFLDRINILTSEHLRIDATAFSRLLDNIWLVWPEWSMPLKSLFISPDFREEWLVEVCTPVYGAADEIWHRREGLQYADLGKQDIDRLKKRPFDNLDPEEKLHFLRDKIGCDIATARRVLQRVLTIISLMERKK